MRAKHIVVLGVMTSSIFAAAFAAARAVPRHGPEAHVYLREVVKLALRLNAAAAIVSHNHLSGDPTPGVADRSVTCHLKEALALVDVRLLDHIIIGGRSSVFMARRGLI